MLIALAGLKAGGPHSVRGSRRGANDLKCADRGCADRTFICPTLIAVTQTTLLLFLALWKRLAICVRNSIG